MANTLPATTLGDITLSSSIIDDPDIFQTIHEEDQWMVDADIALGAAPSEQEAKQASRYVVRITLNRNMMNLRRLTPPDIRRVLRRRLFQRAHVVSSEVYDVEWTIRIRFLNISAMTSHANMPSERQAVLCHRITSVLMKTLLVCGHSSMTAAHARAETVDQLKIVQGSYGTHYERDRRTEHVVDATGASLVDLAAAPMIDWERCYSNDLHEVQTILGIAAASEVLYQELHDVISFDGTHIFPGHIGIIVDTMTRDGRIKPLTRFGVHRDANALARCTYEETPDVLAGAAMYAERTPAQGVSTNIMLGMRADIGTGVTKVRMHSTMLPPHMRSDLMRAPQLMKTTVRSVNVSIPMQYKEYGLATFSTQTERLGSTIMEAPYDTTNTQSMLETLSTEASATKSVFNPEGFQPPFQSTTARVSTQTTTTLPDRSDTSNISVFTIHSPECSDEEEEGTAAAPPSPPPATKRARRTKKKE